MPRARKNPTTKGSKFKGGSAKRQRGVTGNTKNQPKPAPVTRTRGSY